MNHRFLASTGVVGIFVAVVLLAGVFVAAQTPTAAVKPGTPAKTWSVSRTPDGQPELQGFWTNTTYTPLERPKNITKAYYTSDAPPAAAKRAAAAKADQTTPGTIPHMHYDSTPSG